MKEEYKGRMKILIAFGILFLVVAILLGLIFLDSKKTYIVEFDLNGGTLLGGSLTQRVLQGQDAVPPSVVKDGAYLRGWSASYRKVTRNLVVEAVWEYNTTAGIIYSDSENQNFVEIEKAYEFLTGDVYLGAYYNDKKVLGILDGAFKNCRGVTKVYLLDGLTQIGDNAFEKCVSLTEIEIPETVIHVGKYAFVNCSALEKLTLHEGLWEIGEFAFAGCTGMSEVVLPESLISIGANAFAGCENLVIKTTIPEEEWPEGWAEGWYGDATIEFIEPEEDILSEEADEGKGGR